MPMVLLCEVLAIMGFIQCRISLRGELFRTLSVKIRIFWGAVQGGFPESVPGLASL